MMTEQYVNTVSKLVPVKDLGRVLVHEHIFCRVPSKYLPEVYEYLAAQFQELHSYGVTTVVDLTTYVLPDPYLSLVEESPIQVIGCAGYYLQKKVPAAYHDLDAQGLAAKLQQKIELGIGRKRVKPGVIKVASAGRELTRFEKNVMKAAAITQQETKLPIVTHACVGGLRQVEILMSSGANPSRIMLSHTEMEMKGKYAISLEDLTKNILWLLKQGVCLFFGDFTATDTFYRQNLLKLIQTCHSEGYLNQLFISADSYWMYRKGMINVRSSTLNTKVPRTYSYTFKLIIPLLIKNGFSEAEIDVMLKNNPKRFLGISL